MSDRRTSHDLAVATLSDTTVVATLITAARRQLEQERGGYPTSTPGAAPVDIGPLAECRAPDCTQSRPCLVHDEEPVELTPVERLAGQRDPAADALDRLDTLTRKLATYSAEAATICVRWGLPGLTTTDIATRLREIDGTIWCENCSRYGNHEPRAKEHKHCTPCVEFKRHWHELPSKAAWGSRDARGGKWITQDIERIRAREKLERKAAEELRKAAARAEREQVKAS